MAKSLTARLGLQRWSADTDTQERAEFDGGNAKIDDLAALDMQGTLANRPLPAASNRGLYYFVTGDATAANNDKLYRSTGAAWVEVLTGPAASAAYEAKVSRTGASAGQAPLLQTDGTLAFGAVAGGISPAIVDAKGDLIAASAADAVARLPVGANGQVLKADSAAALGLVWGDVGGGGDTVKIAEIVLAATAASITFTGIPQTFRSLFLASVAKCDDVNPAVFMLARLNGDIGTNYDNLSFAASSTGTTTSQVVGGTSMRAGVVNGSHADVAGMAAANALFLPGYSRTDFHKAAIITSAIKQGNASGKIEARQDSAHWRSTAAVTEVTVFLAGTASFLAGTVVTLYGMK